MKFVRSMLLVSVLLLFLAGCGGSRNTLLEGASPDTSALTLYVYDGETVTWQYLFDSQAVQKLLDQLAEVQATATEDFLPTQAAAPIYALEIGGEDGLPRVGAWSDGHWITADGAVYTFDFDFPALLTAYSWEAGDQHSDFSVMPCARTMTCGDSGWNTALLTPAEDLQPPEGISMTLADQADGTLTVTLENTTDTEWAYGEAFSVQALLDGTWYSIPMLPDNWGFNSIGILLAPGERSEKTYDLSFYGTLPAGTYRLVVEGLSAAFTV